MRKLAFAIGGAALVGVAALMASGAPTTAQQPGPRPPVADSIAATRLSVEDSAGLKGPRQPIFFRHDLHAGQFKMQCQYCHYSVDVSPEPGIPSLETCMGCHLVVAGSDSTNRAEITKLRTAWNEK